MKLYATVTSERASKGQGGNERLEITIQDEEKEVLAEITVLPSGTMIIDKGKDVEVVINNYEPRRCHLCGSAEVKKFCTNTSCYEYTRYEPKGNKQKTAKVEKCHYEGCKNPSSCNLH